MKIFSGIQPTGDKHLGNLIGGFRQYAATQEQGDAFFCIVDLHSITVEYEPDDLRARSLDLAAMLFATGLDPRTLDRLLPEPRDRARRGGLAALGRHELRTARQDDAVQGEGRPAGVRLRRALHVSRPDGGRHPPVPDRHRPDRRRPAPAPRAGTRRRAAVQLALRRDVRRPGGCLSGGRRADHGPAGADEEDVDDRRDGAGDASAPRRARRHPPEVQDRRDRLRPRGPPRGGQARDHEPDRDSVGGGRRVAGGDRGSLRRLRVRRLQGGGRRSGRRARRPGPGALPGVPRRRGGAAPAARPRRGEGAGRVGTDPGHDVSADGLRRRARLAPC